MYYPIYYGRRIPRHSIHRTMANLPPYFDRPTSTYLPTYFFDFWYVILYWKKPSQIPLFLPPKESFLGSTIGLAWRRSP